MIRTSIANEPGIEGDAVVVRVVVEDTQVEDTGEVFECRLKTFDDVRVDTFPEGRTPSSAGEYRAIAAETAREFALGNREAFERLFAALPPRQN